ncbi:MAG: hypothetical protein J3R72DRAFT_165141 [Linnemannia gamsii]|nr:MAG: hypothetical protein J3R72DRAFT_165141 [Linnemannia gamsii]
MSIFTPFPGPFAPTSSFFPFLSFFPFILFSLSLSLFFPLLSSSSLLFTSSSSSALSSFTCRRSFLFLFLHSPLFSHITSHPPPFDTHSIPHSSAFHVLLCFTRNVPPSRIFVFFSSATFAFPDSPFASLVTSDLQLFRLISFHSTLHFSLSYTLNRASSCFLKIQTCSIIYLFCFHASILTLLSSATLPVVVQRSLNPKGHSDPSRS